MQPCQKRPNRGAKEALECFFQSNAYHPQATCDQCGHSGRIPISIRADTIPTVLSRPAEMLTPKVLPECQLQGRSLTAVLTSPPTGGYVAILIDPIESVIQWYDVQISTSEGISTSSDFHHPFQIEGARWHLLRDHSELWQALAWAQN